MSMARTLDRLIPGKKRNKQDFRVKILFSVMVGTSHFSKSTE